MNTVEERVIAEIRARRERGLRKYGVGLERGDLALVDWLQHAKEEALDLALYLQRAMDELKRRKARTRLRQRRSPRRAPVA